MATLQNKIADKFLSSLAESGEVDAEKLELIRQLITKGKKPKADDFAKVFSTPKGGNVK